MAHELKVPQVGESVQEVQVGRWLVPEGGWADKDQDLVEIETDKASVEVSAPVAGIVKVLKQEGEPAEVGEVIGYLEPQEKRSAGKQSPPPTAEQKSSAREAAPPSKSPAAKTSSQPVAATLVPEEEEEEAEPGQGVRVMPSARRLLTQYGLTVEEVQPTGPGGRLLQEDVLRHIQEHHLEEKAAGDRTGSPSKTEQTPSPAAAPEDSGAGLSISSRHEEVVPMSLIRRRIAARLVEAQQTAALLTTFNEVDMSTVMNLRQSYKDTFQKKHGVKLGFMAFFVKAAVEALKAFPAVNAEIRGNSIVYHNFYDIGVAIGSGKGLVVPVLRNAERMSFAEIEKTIAELAARAQENKLTPDELTGGTFTISNGGVYGSLLSTPIVNPPQSGILGMHAIQDRPVAHQGQVVIRPMMYLALTYDHRIVDGREAVSFLRHIKETIEDPARMLLEI